MKPTLTVRDERIWNGDQSLYGSRIVRWGSELLRASIRRDAYDNQSSAVVEVWCIGRGWREVQRVPIQDLPVAACSYVTKPERFTAPMRESLTLLCELGVTILRSAA